MKKNLKKIKLALHFFLYKIMHRPLITLFPFLVLGSYLGWCFSNINLLIFKIIAVMTIFLSLIFYKKLTIASIFLTISVVFVSWINVSSELIPPKDPHHVLNLINPLSGQSESGLVLGGILTKPVSKTKSGYQIIIKAQETFFLSEKGPKNHQKASGLVKINLPADVEPDLLSGEKIRVPIILRSVTGFKNPKTFNYERYWAGKKIWVNAWLKSPRLITSYSEKSKITKIVKARQIATKIIKEETNEPNCGLMLAQLTGARTAVDENMEEVFRNLGLSHILSVSGLHFSIWGIICFLIIKNVLLLYPTLALKIRINAWAAFISIFPLLYYAFLAGDEITIKRSAIMAILVIIAIFISRKTDPINILSFAAWSILLIWPLSLFSPSYQLSFSACLAILILSKASSFYFKKKITKKWWWNLTLLSLAGGLGTAPIVVYHFGHFNWAGLWANIIFTSVLSFWILPAGLIGVFMAPIFPQIAGFIFKTIAFGLDFLMPLLEILAAWVGKGPMLTRPSISTFIIYYGLFFILLNIKLTYKFKIKVILSLFIFFIFSSFLQNIYSLFKAPELNFTVLDIGQGTAIHINFPNNKNLIFDAGPALESFDAGEALIKPYLLAHGIRKVDIFALSHPQNDHMGGFENLILPFKPKEFWSVPWPKDLNQQYKNIIKNLRIVKAKRETMENLSAGFDFAEAKIKILWPPDNYQPQLPLSGKELNNNSLVIMLEYQGKKALFPGDIEAQTEEKLVKKYGKELKADILVAPHHGSNTSLSLGFLHQVRPSVVIISSGRYNRFNFPNQEVINRLKLFEIKIWRTDQKGAAQIKIKNNKISIKEDKVNVFD